MENSADQAALSFLDRAGYSAEGLMHFLERLENQELVPTDRQVEYVRTHPLTRHRVAAVRNHVAHSPNTGKPSPAGYHEVLPRVNAKLSRFLSQAGVMRRLPPRAPTPPPP